MYLIENRCFWIMHHALTNDQAAQIVLYFRKSASLTVFDLMSRAIGGTPRPSVIESAQCSHICSKNQSAAGGGGDVPNPQFSQTDGVRVCCLASKANSSDSAVSISVCC